MSKPIVTIAIRYPKIVVLEKGIVVDGFFIKNHFVAPGVEALQEKWENEGYTVRNRLRDD